VINVVNWEQGSKKAVKNVYRIGVIPVSDYMEFYNYGRFHQTLKYKKPMQVYFESLQADNKSFNISTKIEA